MNCHAARLAIGTDPDASDAALEAHLGGCEDCRRFQAEMRKLERDLRSVLAAAPLSGSAASPLRADRGLRRSARASAPLALAASLAVLLASALIVWSLRPSTALAADVVTHLKGEPGSWSSTGHPAPADLSALLDASGVSLASENVVYARRCVFRGHAIAHLVVRTPSGSWTVMVLTHEHVKRPQRFSEEGYTGELLPARRGALAVIGLSSDSAQLAAVAREVSRAIHYRS
jgi:hypothetical protein